ncbi:aminotransferase class I/II-fold pyridoxal phosphate-dependent enzyme [Bosea sp. (in: a-proteobacteria)]|uniref:aminotransferase class I/II-fold pyridoxal phosphate-dependent enzyme n=1 Tax=Bosea sp. (in: a-proteobacteria) TaxID=1871050 RepID=UPI0026279A14|nr:aminotransferase class I/II-fold pyridoxal phosphate-dependent enzyme [Bosea sp. (in: a-proteobacteria)]MCO5092986.1 aminotransferase class I/II-fold pyridoxal phosphate-dependent enzyme [Bosea sp. (in: a-proteobacteria)]
MPQPLIMPALAKRAERVAPFIVMDVMNQAAAIERRGGSVVHMEVGQPSAPTPASIRAAAARALEHGRIGYTQALGTDSLRARIARHYQDTHGVAVAAERVVVTTGSSGGFILAFLACFEPGARIAITAPGYPAYRNILIALGLEPVAIEVGPETRFALTPELIERAHREKPLAGVLTMSPANPTGVVMAPGAIADVAACCRRLRLWYISDEIYHGLTYETPATTALAADPEAIIVNSFSKYYCMTGWRVGWLVVPPRLVRTIERLQQNFSISVPYLSQVAGEAAFDATVECEAIKAGYARNRAFLLKALPEIGLGDFLPVDGAFYIYLDIGRHSNDSMAFCRAVLEEAGVAITPGLDFDEARGSRTIRLSFAGSLSECEEAVARIGGWLKKR